MENFFSGFNISGINATFNAFTINKTQYTTGEVQRPLPYRPLAVIVVEVILLAIIGVIITLGNLALIVAYFRTKSLRRRRSYSLIISLSFADLLVSVAVFMALYFFLTGTQLFSFTVTTDFVDVFTVTTSLLTFAAIAMERFYAVYFPHRYRVLKFRVYVMCIVLPWVVGFANGCCLIISGLLRHQTTFRAVYLYGRFLPASFALFIIIVCYISIFFKIRKSSIVVFQHQTRSTHDESRSTHDHTRSTNDESRSTYETRVTQEESNSTENQNRLILHDHIRSPHDHSSGTKEESNSLDIQIRLTHDHIRSPYDQSCGTHENQSLSTSNQIRLTNDHTRSLHDQSSGIQEESWSAANKTRLTHGDHIAHDQSCETQENSLSTSNQIRLTNDHNRSLHDQSSGTQEYSNSTTNQTRSTHDKSRAFYDRIRSTRNKNRSTNDQSRSVRERKLSITLLIVTLASLATCLPQLCHLLAVIFAKLSLDPLSIVFFIVKFLQYCNSGINVLVYIARMPDIRNSILGLLHK